LYDLSGSDFKKMPTKIMIIDDDVTVVNMIKEVLEGEALVIDTFLDPLDALKEIKSSNYDLFLIDLKLPNIDGTTLLKMIKEEQKTARCIIITAYGDTDSVIKAFKAGVSDFILKPCRSEDLLNCIKKQLEEKDRTDYDLKKWGKMAEDIGLIGFKNFFNEFDISVIGNLDDCQTKLKDLSSKYDQITKQNIKTLKRMSAKIKKENKLASSMLSYVSHEIKSPLHSIIGYTRTLLKQCELGKTESMHEFLNDILTSSLYVLDLTHNILSSSVLEADKLRREQVCIGEILKNIRSSLISSIKAKNLTYKEDIQPGLISVTADKLKLTQILYNLMDNAIEYSESGGITVEVKKADSKNSVLFVVRDTGVGIRYKDKSKLFKKFSRLNLDKKKGAGLGLYIAKKLVKMHGGRIWVESRFNSGSAFYFTIPSNFKNNP
jgi:signal transduction histidine kinase/CheY-like chemotaxis protein